MDLEEVFFLSEGPGDFVFSLERLLCRKKRTLLSAASGQCLQSDVAGPAMLLKIRTFSIFLSQLHGLARPTFLKG